jgi:hypothetical protein
MNFEYRAVPKLSMKQLGSRALNMSGAFNIGIHPYFLHLQMYLRSMGVRPSLFSYHSNGL